VKTRTFSKALEFERILSPLGYRKETALGELWKRLLIIIEHLLWQDLWDLDYGRIINLKIKFAL